MPSKWKGCTNKHCIDVQNQSVTSLSEGRNHITCSIFLVAILPGRSSSYPLSIHHISRSHRRSISLSVTVSVSFSEWSTTPLWRRSWVLRMTICIISFFYEFRFNRWAMELRTTTRANFSNLKSIVLTLIYSLKTIRSFDANWQGKNSIPYVQRISLVDNTNEVGHCKIHSGKVEPVQQTVRTSIINSKAGKHLFYNK